MNTRHSPQKQNSSLYRSFAWALAGIATALLRERNLRIHTAVTAGVFCYAHYFDLTRGEWLGLILTVGFVIVCELLNSAIERAVDYTGTKRSPLAKAAKDTAAGAVLVAALVSVAVGILLFWQPDILTRIWADTLEKPLPAVLGIIAALLWVILPGLLQRKGR